MVQFITPLTQPIALELDGAYRVSRRRMRIQRYRSRTEVTEEHIQTAYAWLKLPIIIGDSLNREYIEHNIFYKTASIPRGVDPDTALSMSLEELTMIMTAINQHLKIMMFNTGTAAAASERIKNWFEQQEVWSKLELDPFIISAPNHKIDIYYNVVNNAYVILNNLDTPTVLFKIAAIIMLKNNFFGDATAQLAEAWITGNGDTINNAVKEYYKEYNVVKVRKEREAAIEQLYNNMTADIDDSFKRKISSINTEMQDLFTQISDLNKRLNVVKAAYLLNKLENTNDKLEELKVYFRTCGDKITALRYTDNTLHIVYKTSLLYFEPELLTRYFESTRNNCIKNAHPYKQQLLKDIFLKNKYELLIESGVALNTYDASVNFDNPSNYISDAIKYYGIPNPHHRYYNCWGDNKPAIVQALSDKDYITAITISFAAMSGLNIADTAVMEKFLIELQEYENINCLKNKETGEIINIATYRRRFEDALHEVE